MSKSKTTYLGPDGPEDGTAMVNDVDAASANAGTDNVTVQLVALVTPTFAAKVKRLAKQDGRKPGAMVRRLIELGVKTLTEERSKR